MRPDNPRRPIDEWSEELLVEELLDGLREVGVRNEELPDLGEIRTLIVKIKLLWAQVTRRDINIDIAITVLAQQTGWPMRRILEASLQFPSQIPFINTECVRLCGNCGEVRPRSAALSLCDDCLEMGLEKLRGSRDSHLDKCSVCGAAGRGYLVYAYGTEWMNYGLECLEEERARRGL